MRELRLARGARGDAGRAQVVQDGHKQQVENECTRRLSEMSAGRRDSLCAHEAHPHDPAEDGAEEVVAISDLYRKTPAEKVGEKPRAFAE